MKTFELRMRYLEIRFKPRRFYEVCGHGGIPDSKIKEQDTGTRIRESVRVE